MGKAEAGGKGGGAKSRRPERFTRLPVLHFLFGPFSSMELLLLIFCWFFIVVTGIQNLALEIALTKLHPEIDESIGLSKDLAAGAVTWAFVFGLICLYFILSGRL